MSGKRVKPETTGGMIIPELLGPEEASASEILLYATEDGGQRIQVRLENGTVWLSQKQIAELFQTTPQNITAHLRGIFRDGELLEEATCKQFLQVQAEGGRSVRRRLKLYNLNAILAVGYRVRSPRGVQFRQWATERLREYLVKGFVLDDERLKEGYPGGKDHFDELLERIRDIRSSEKASAPTTDSGSSLETSSASPPPRLICHHVAMVLRGESQESSDDPSSGSGEERRRLFRRLASTLLGEE